MNERFTLLRCGYCGSFCDNTGREFEATKQLIAADESVGFEDALGVCSSCSPPCLADAIKEQESSDELGLLRAKANKYTSTGATS